MFLFQYLYSYYCLSIWPCWKHSLQCMSCCYTLSNFNSPMLGAKLAILSSSSCKFENMHVVRSFVEPRSSNSFIPIFFLRYRYQQGKRIREMFRINSFTKYGRFSFSVCSNRVASCSGAQVAICTCQETSRSMEFSSSRLYSFPQC